MGDNEISDDSRLSLGIVRICQRQVLIANPRGRTCAIPKPRCTWKFLLPAFLLLENEEAPKNRDPSVGQENRGYLCDKYEIAFQYVLGKMMVWIAKHYLIRIT
jgi:hypothetical protein